MDPGQEEIQENGGGSREESPQVGHWGEGGRGPEGIASKIWHSGKVLVFVMCCILL